MDACIYIETDDGSELAIPIEFTYYHRDAVIHRAPEDCHPEEESFEWWHDENHNNYSALEWWAIDSVSEDVVWQACLDEISDGE